MANSGNEEPRSRRAMRRLWSVVGDHPRLTTVDVDHGELRVSWCGNCGRCYGLDDSMDAETLALLLVDEELCRDVQTTVITCTQCRNDDVNRFVVVEGDADRMVLRVKCMDCSTVCDVQLKDWENETSGAWMEEVPGSVEDTDEDGDRWLWIDDDSGYVVDSDDNHDVGGCHDASEDVLSCRCGNSEFDCFQTHFNAESGDLASVTCLACDQVKAIKSFFGVECGHCENDNEELFEKHFDSYGRMTWLRCFVCGKRLDLPGQPSPRAGMKKQSRPGCTFAHPERGRARVVRGTVGLGWTKITDLCDIQRGDHIAWHKWYAICHHAIVVDVPHGGRALTVIHYNGDVKKLDGHLASVRLETIDINPDKEDLYRVDYPAGTTYPVEIVIQRAADRLFEAEYNPFTNNCEHFARWCKTDRAECGQVRKFVDRLQLVHQRAVTKLTEEAVAEGLESLVAGTLGRAAVSSIRQRAGQVFGVTSGAVRNMRCGALACGIAVNLALEAAMFTKDAIVAYREYRSGSISRDELRRQLCKLGCETAAGLIGGSLISILLQVVIPVPFVGGFVGCVLGSLITRYLGAIIGKQLGAIEH